MLTTIALAQIQSLENWQVSIDGGETFSPITVPSPIEDSIDMNFDGISIYRIDLPIVPFQADQRAVLNFSAVATQATVFVNEQQVATHLGGWTPFWVDITDAWTRSTTSDPLELKVVVDEKIGHNTQGFLPVVTNHFGGIWQPVQLHITGSTWVIEELAVVRVRSGGRSLHVELPICSDVATSKPDQPLQIKLSFAAVQAGTTQEWKPLSAEFVQQSLPQKIQGSNQNRRLETWLSDVSLPDELKYWSPQDPQLYALKVELVDGSKTIDSHELQFGSREFHTDEDRFVLNGQPLSIRGVLNWGYAPPSVAPSLDADWMANEIKFAQQRGFNLMKFCLWIPPQQYLDLCDQMGMLAWIEYPTWHPQLDAQHLTELRQEYSEFFAYDRNHPCIILRSLTCETGPSADIEVVRSLYDQCKLMIPDAVVEDDSSWISWNRVHDFYDDHPYGNNHTWVSSLNDLRQYMADRVKKPLALGEAIAADSWLEPSEQAIGQAASQLAHGSWSIADNGRWQRELSELAASRHREFDPQQLYPQSVHYGMLMRKFQIETFHREFPRGGYVVSVLRDFPKASMGLIDANGKPKTSPKDWQFQGDEMLLLQTRNDRRSFDGGSAEVLTVIEKNLSTVSERADGKPAERKAGRLMLTLRDLNNGVVWSESVDVERAATELSLHQFSVSFPRVENPQRFVLDAKWQLNNNVPAIVNSWPLWVFPVTDLSTISTSVHSSANSWAESIGLNVSTQSTSNASSKLPIIAQRLDDELLDRLEQGANVLLIPDGKLASLPLQQHWFLRGSVVALPRANATSGKAWHSPFEQLTDNGVEQLNMLVELQHFDLAGAVVPNIGHYLEKTDPLILLWDNHDLRETRTHGLVFELPMGQGRMLVSALNHQGPTNAAGRWLLKQWLEQLSDSTEPKNNSSLSNLETSSSQLLKKLRGEMNRQQLSLTQNAWQFQPDPKQRGVTEGWFKPGWDDSKWSPIRIDRHWEGQGHAALDNWAWYRTSLTLPENFGTSAYLNLNGIDDYADIYVNGTKIGSVGDIIKKETAFETRLSLDISRQLSSGKSIQLSIAVYDWYGAGGIFRPITISSQPISQDPPILVGP